MPDRAGPARRRRERRRFLRAVGTATAATLVTSGAAPAAAAGFTSLLEPGLVYLNTGSVGPASQAVLDATVRAWRQLEANPSP